MMKSQISQSSPVLVTLDADEIKRIHQVDQILYRLIDETDGTESVEINDTAREAYYGIHNLLGIIKKFEKPIGENGACVYEIPIQSIPITKEDDH